jgi:hypothetical protein
MNKPLHTYKPLHRREFIYKRVPFVLSLCLNSGVLATVVQCHAQVPASPKPVSAAPISISAEESRTAFRRMEQGAALKVKVNNKTADSLQNAVLEVSARGLLNQRITVPHVAANQSTLVAVPLDARMRADRYAATVRLLDAGGKLLGEALNLNITIAARPLPHTMPVIMWGGGDDNVVKEIGFTHQLHYPANLRRIWEQGANATAMSPKETLEVRQRYDRMFALGLGAVAYLSPGRYVGTDHPEFNRINRQGKRLSNANGLFPRVQQYAYDTGSAVARTFGDLPALQSALVHTEIRDHTEVSLHDIDKAAYRKFSGQEIPEAAVGKRGVAYQTIKGFPKDRIVADNDPLLRYYSWFWKRGDGWYDLNTQVDKGLKSTGRKDIWTFFDPAVRTPSVYGATGEVDYLSQWTYTYPEPEKIGLATDELAAMAAGADKPQDIMSMTQIIWYRSQTAPLRRPEQGPIANQPAWEKQFPDAQFITISPDILSESLWLKLSRPVKGILYHGWGSLAGSHRSYRLTNTEARPRLTKLIHDVVQPLGPTLLQVPDAPTDVAFLESFASQMFANRGTWGWGNSWAADAYLISRYAALQPRIVYDETIVQQGLDAYKVLFLTDCDVLSQSVADNIRKWQQRGGIVVGDNRLAPGIEPDILLSSFKRTNQSDQDKTTLLQKAAELRKQLDEFYDRAVDSSNPEVLVRQRRFGNSDYVFVANDHRTFGDYVGQYKRVMEKGLPSTTTIVLNRPRGIVYDLMRRQAVPTTAVGNKLRFNVALGPGEGTAFMVTDVPVGTLQITAPAQVQRGKSLDLRLRLSGANRKPMSAVVPIKLSIRDPQGRESERSGYYGAANGQLAVTLDIAANDAAGQWQIEATEGLLGRKTLHSLTVN